MTLLPRFYYFLAAAIFCALLSSSWPDGLPVSICLIFLLSGSVIADYINIPAEALQARRDSPSTVQQGQPASVTLHLSNRCPSAATFTLLDSPPTVFTQPKEKRITLPTKGEAQHTYSILSYTRGEYTFGPLFYKIHGPLGLVQRISQVPLPAPVQVVPDLGLGQESLHGDSYRPIEFGTHISRFGGKGQEFESLREHHHDDDWRQIDWKASAKRNQWIQRQYEFEQDQQLMILIDSGRLMATPVSPYLKLDHSIKASSRLARLAHKQGDLFGYTIFDERIRAYSSPKRGPDQLATMTRELTTLQPTHTESDYLSVFKTVHRRLPRRSLIICFTDLSDSASALTLVKAARLLMTKHRLVIVTISDSPLLAIVRHKPRTEQEIYRFIAASQFWNEYQKVQAILRNFGTLTINVPADQMTLAAVSTYAKLTKRNV